MARVRDVIRRATSSELMRNVLGSISANMGMPPNRVTALAVAKKV